MTGDCSLFLFSCLDNSQRPKVVPQPVPAAIHCINPECPRPYPQVWGNNFCQTCGASLRLNHRYIPLQRLGSGGFAAIYTVWDLQTQAERVLKVLLETSPKAMELFEQEARVLASLHQPGIPKVEPDGYFQVEIRSFASVQGNYAVRRLSCLVMEKIDGKTLQDILEEYPQGCAEVWVFNWLWQAIEILRELHGHLIIHRDIKPSNLMLRQQTGHLVMIDFGGAKQVGDLGARGSQGGSAQASSTRLISPGYSPPEQIVGGGVGPASDFYALGRTCIHLLTGKYPADLADPLTGELRWRNLASVSPAFANLLDEMVRLDVRQRPASAGEIEERLAKISAVNHGGPSWLAPVGQATINFLWEALVGVAEGMGNLTVSLFGAIAQTVVACLDTAWEMTLGGLWGMVGAVTGLVLAYWSPTGDRFAYGLAQLLLALIPDRAVLTALRLPAVGPELLLFGLAGLGTAIGLTSAGGFRQRRRYGWAGLAGAVGYGLAGLCWCGAIVGSSPQEMLVVGALAIAFLPLGMGLRSHQLVHGVVSAIGTVGVFAALNSFNLSLQAFFHFLWLSNSRPDWLQFWGCIGFFGLLGSANALCLGISHYLIVPVLRWLGWR